MDNGGGGGGGRVVSGRTLGLMVRKWSKLAVPGRQQCTVSAAQTSSQSDRKVLELSLQSEDTVRAKSSPHSSCSMRRRYYLNIIFIHEFPWKKWNSMPQSYASCAYFQYHEIDSHPGHQNVFRVLTNDLHKYTIPISLHKNKIK